MNKQNDITLLVLPELFPDFEGDWKGVFIEDYLEAVSSINTQTLYIRLTGEQKGVKDEKFKTKFNVRRYCVSDHKVNPALKPFLYIKWFIKGIEFGTAYKNTNIIHAHGAVLNGSLAYFISKKLGVPYVVSEHTGPYKRILNSWIKRNISKFVFKKASKILVVSEHQKNEVQKLGIPKEKIEVSYNPINTNTFNINYRNSSEKNIVFTSRLDEFKGGLRTLKAFHQITDKFPDYKLIIVGEGEEYSLLEQFIKTNQLAQKVILKGSLSKAEIANIYHSCSFMVFPSRHETFGLVAAEALCCGLPVICTNKTAPKEFINSNNGILVEPDDIDAIANAMSKMIENIHEYSSNEIHQGIKDRFGLENFGKYLIGIYRSLI